MSDCCFDINEDELGGRIDSIYKLSSGKRVVRSVL